MACPMGAAQFTHTPSGAPSSMPCTEPANFPPRGWGSSGTIVRRAAASRMPNVIPCLFVTPHSAATQRTRLNFWSARGSGKWPSNPSGVDSASSGSAPALLCSDGYREPSQKMAQMVAITAPMMTMRASRRRAAARADLTAMVGMDGRPLASVEGQRYREAGRIVKHLSAAWKW